MSELIIHKIELTQEQLEVLLGSLDGYYNEFCTFNDPLADVLELIENIKDQTR